MLRGCWLLNYLEVTSCKFPIKRGIARHTQSSGIIFFAKKIKRFRIVDKAYLTFVIKVDAESVDADINKWGMQFAVVCIYPTQLSNM